MPRLWRLTPIIALAIALILLVAGMGLAFYIDRSNENRTTAEVTVQARILASTVTAALVFNDHDAAQEYVSAMQANPEVQQAAVYDSAGRLFAGWSRDGQSPLPATEHPHAPRLDHGHLIVSSPVAQENLMIGTVYLESVTEALGRRIQRYGAIALLVIMAVLLVGVLWIAQRALTRANVALADRARQLAAANESLLAEIEQREQIEAALRQAQKMEAIGQLTGGVAHDFNNLLQVILGNLERLQRRFRDSDLGADASRLIASAARGAERAAILTQRLLAFSRRQPLAPKPLEINKLVAGLSDLIGRTLGESVQLQTVLAGGLWRALADANQLESALLNLAVNARDAMPSGGKLTIETANAHLDEAYARTESDEVKAGQYVLIQVTDTGTGMGPDVLAKVFEPFFTTKDIGQGTGLGLSQVYGFAKQSGGHVKIYSEVGVGTTVKLYLPRATVIDSPLRDHSDDGQVPGGNSREMILVVEDQDDVRAFTSETLRDLGYSVSEAADGPAALHTLEHESRIRLLFTDIGLPGGINGRQLADQARRRYPELLVLFTTGYARNAIVHHGRLDPGVELIGKPFTQTELALRIREIFDRAVGANWAPG
ncbi:MAG TPA: CHASE sensor domain-containing protein [Acetobacteraceae bacterium]|nr:CHASE sensor domain-containing protein [Acetobacteraceae bacterium]